MPSVDFTIGSSLRHLGVSVLLLVCFVPCEFTPASEPLEIVDPRATPATRDLLKRLHDQSGKGVLFGSQDATAYGVGWWAERGRCDIKDVCGNWPAIYGWDLGDIHRERNLDGVDFKAMRQWMLEAHERGGINAISLHLDNPVTGKNAWDSTPAVGSILPGGSHHEPYLRTLDRIASFINSLQDGQGAPIPVVLRPYHEHNQDWSWWGKKACSEAEYVELWQMTVRHLRDKRNVHHILYAYSPQDIASETDYMYAYPGDEFVDVFGLDYYQAWNRRQVHKMGQALSLVNRLAAKHHKVAALTETGIENVPISTWWTDMLFKALQHDEWSRRTVWAMVWRNKSKGHHFGPYPNHPSADNFVRFADNPFVILSESKSEPK